MKRDRSKLRNRSISFRTDGHTEEVIDWLAMRLGVPKVRAVEMALENLKKSEERKMDRAR